MASDGPQDIEVNKDDQKRINRFSRLNLRYDDLDEQIKNLKKDVQTYTDATEEIEGCMESDGVMIKIGEAYSKIDEDSAVERLAKLSEQAETSLREKTDEIEKVKEEMDAE